jgi:hypothetical protein
MSGVHGQRGRRSSSPAQQAQARKARVGKGAGSTAEPAEAVVGDDPEVERRMAAIRVPEPQTWQEARIREQTKAEIYRTLVAASQLKQERRDLVPRKEVAAAAEAVRDMVQRHLEQVPRLVADSLDLAPALRAQIVVEVGNRIRLALAQAISEAARE